MLHIFVMHHYFDEGVRKLFLLWVVHIVNYMTILQDTKKVTWMKGKFMYQNMLDLCFKFQSIYMYKNYSFIFFFLHLTYFRYFWAISFALCADPLVWEATSYVTRELKKCNSNVTDHTALMGWQETTISLIN